jgi:hypothetical protein
MKTVGCFAPGFIQPVTGLRIGVVLGGFRVGAGFPVDARWFGNRVGRMDTCAYWPNWVLWG